MRILSGIQATGALHLGRYYGAVRQFLDLQSQGEGYYFIADYHALTSIRDPETLARNTQRIAIEFLALGLDPTRAVLFRQSDVPEVCELAWVLSTVTPMGLLQRCHSYKDKVAQGLPAEHGLFAYPVLMAADILLYRADVVPVGQDQQQHVEVTRDLAIKFHETYGEAFTIPEARFVAASKVPGTDGQKMSNSYQNTIPVFGPEKELRKRYLGIVTDSTPMEDPKEPEGNTIYELFKLVAPPPQVAEMATRFRAGNYGYGHAKQALFEAYLEAFGPARARYDELVRNPAEVEAVLQDGARRARATATPVLDRVRHLTGISRRN